MPPYYNPMGTKSDYANPYITLLIYYLLKTDLPQWKTRYSISESGKVNLDGLTIEIKDCDETTMHKPAAKRGDDLGGNEEKPFLR